MCLETPVIFMKISLLNNVFWCRFFLSQLAASSGYDWLLDDECQYKSITEMLICQGAFSTDPKGAAAAHRFCFFYFRQPDHLQQPPTGSTHQDPDLGGGEGSEETWVYLPASESEALNVERLKTAIVRRGLSIRYFLTVDQLGSLVLDDWKRVIEDLYPTIESKHRSKMAAQRRAQPGC